MTHDELRDDLPLFASGDLEPEARVALEAHLADCDTCAQELRSLEDALSLLRGLGDTAAPQADLCSARPRPPRSSAWSPLLRWSARAAALVAAFLAGAWSARPPAPPVVKPPEHSTRIERKLERAVRASREGQDEFARSLLGLSVLLREER